MEGKGTKRKKSSLRLSKSKKSEDSSDYYEEDWSEDDYEEELEEIDLKEVLDEHLDVNEEEIKSKEQETKKSKKSTKSRSRKSSKEETNSSSLREEYELTAEQLCDFKWEIREEKPPPELSPDITLLPFQRESLAWMTEQESNPTWRGGILADDMGMGKTLQAINLLLKTRNTSGIGSKSTLVVCPLVALSQWRTEIEKYTQKDTLKVLIYHGSDRITNQDELQQNDVILTSYSVVETEFRYETVGFKRKGEKVKKPSILHGMEFQRIILDEAHYIKDRSCSTARAVFALRSAFRWSLTGTPLQNRIGELFSLVKFLKITPYSFYYCKKCDCKSLSWKFSKGTGCEECGHSGMSHFAWWNKNVLNPIKKYGLGDNKGKEALRVLKSILQRIMLRRTKVEKAKDLCLPPRVIRLRYDQLDEEENDFYEALYTKSKTKFMGFVAEDTILNNYAHVFDLLLRLRQAVDHPYLVLYAKESMEEGDGTDWCNLCQEPADDPMYSRCKHTFCKSCITSYMDTDSTGNCPVCHRPITINLEQSEKGGFKKNAVPKPTKNILQRVDPENWRTSTKIEALMEELTKIKENNPNAKSLVFSQFVNFLDLIDWRLKTAGFKCVKLDGRMNMMQKTHAIAAFNEDPETTIFLISLKAGGIALNLTIASYCFLLDPWWNPAAEFQAIDRIYRLGQFKCINVIRFIIPNTIEDRIMQLQEKKHLLFNSTVGMDNESLNRLSVADLKFLFH